jgi:hypothetical protein
MHARSLSITLRFATAHGRVEDGCVEKAQREAPAGPRIVATA